MSARSAIPRAASPCTAPRRSILASSPMSRSASPTGGTFSDATPTTAPAVPPPDKPSLLIAGSADVIAPLPRVEAAYEALPTPKALAVIDGVTHLGFMDICEITPPGEPNVLQVAKDAGVAVPDLILRLFADGCDPKYTSPSSAWPAINALHDGAPPRIAGSRRPAGRAHTGRPRRGVSRPPRHAVEIALIERPGDCPLAHGVWHLSSVRQATRVGLVIALAAALVSACASESGGHAPSVEARVVEPSATSSVSPTTSSRATRRPPTPDAGPYPVGVTEITSGPTPISVFYPALEGSQDGKAPADL